MKNLYVLLAFLFSSWVLQAQTYDFLPQDLKKMEVKGGLQLKLNEIKAYRGNGESISLTQLTDYLKDPTYDFHLFVDDNEKVKAIVFVPKNGNTQEKANTESIKDETLTSPSKPIQQKRQVYKSSPFMLGQVAPNFTLKTLSGKSIALNDYADRPIVLNFWFTSCAPCIREIPELNQLVEKYKQHDVVFLAIGLDNPQRIKDFLMKHPFSYNILPNGLRVARSFGVSAYPTHLLLNPEKEVVYSQVGYFSGLMHSLEIALDKLLELN